MALEILFVKLLFLVSLASSQVAARAVIVGEQDFHDPPTNLNRIRVNETSVLLDNKTNIIRGWSYEGTVWYLLSDKISLTGYGNSLQLGPNGMINYTVYCDVNFKYFLTFSLFPSSPYCTNNATAVSVSDTVSYPHFSKVFLYKESLGEKPWQTHAYSFGAYGDYVTLQIQSVAAISHGNIACWPIIDDLLLMGIDREEIRENDGVDYNLFSNSGFEVGPGMYPSQSILLDADSNLNTSSSFQLPLDPWIVLGTVKYIDSNSHAVPQGRRAVELISASGIPSGIAYNASYDYGITYTLEFIMGDAGDSCVGDLTVVVQAGRLKWNFMMKSNGVGSSKKYSVKFELKRTYGTNAVPPITFVSYSETRTSDHQELCGPVIDAMFLGTHSASHSTRLPSGLAIIVSVVIFFFFA